LLLAVRWLELSTHEIEQQVTATWVYLVVVVVVVVGGVVVVVVVVVGVVVVFVASCKARRGLI
jgi:hypothetical protein